VLTALKEGYISLYAVISFSIGKQQTKAFLTGHCLVAVISHATNIFPGFFQSLLFHASDTSSTDYAAFAMDYWTQIT